MVVMFVLTGMAILGQVLYQYYVSAFLALFIDFIKIDNHGSMCPWVSLKHLKVIRKILHSLHSHTRTHACAHARTRTHTHTNTRTPIQRHWVCRQFTLGCSLTYTNTPLVARTIKSLGYSQTPPYPETWCRIHLPPSCLGVLRLLLHNTTLKQYLGVLFGTGFSPQYHSLVSFC